MDKYSELLANLPFDLLHIAQSCANDNKSPKIEPAHLLRALLHKSAGLVNYIEDTLDEDYYYLVDWTDMRMKQCDKSPYGMKGIEPERANGTLSAGFSRNSRHRLLLRAVEDAPPAARQDLEADRQRSPRASSR